MWIIFALFSAFFAGTTAILAKCGIKNTDSDLATAVRTSVILLFSWIIVFISGVWGELSKVSANDIVFLVLSGLATAFSWVFYFKALSNGNINQVTAIDKSSVILTLLFAIIFLNETNSIIIKISAILLIGAGTYMMLELKRTSAKGNKSSLVYASLSAVFAALTSILSKIGINNINSNLGTAIRTIVVFLAIWAIVFSKGKIKQIKSINKRELMFICLSGIASGASWLCYYKALKDGFVTAVVPIDKLSIVFTVIFAGIVFKEKLTFKSLAGLILIITGTLLLALFV